MNSEGKDELEITRTPIVVSIIALLLAVVGDWPYGYFILLRFCVCGTAAYLALSAKTLNLSGWQWTMWGIALLFNPLIPFYMDRSSWQLLDLVAVPIFLVSAFAIKPRRSPWLWWIVGGTFVSLISLFSLVIYQSNRPRQQVLTGDQNRSVSPRPSQPKVTGERRILGGNRNKRSDESNEDSPTINNPPSSVASTGPEESTSTKVDLSYQIGSLTPEEQQSIEAACSQAKYREGPATYNECLWKQLRLSRP